MIVEVLAIGDELTSGQRLDTNSQWLSQRLGDLGLPVLYHSTAGDQLAALTGMMRLALERSDILVATGGLGPTADDLTRDAIAAAIGKGLALDHGSLEHIQNLFARRGRTMPERNTIQAMLPEGCTAIPNPEGTAPGIQLVLERPGRSPARLYSLPGVPAEMKQMWAQTVSVDLARLLPPQAIQFHVVKCFGVGESELEAKLPDMIRRGREPEVGITVHEATITLRIAARGTNLEACQAQIAPTVQTIHECLGNLVFGSEDDELQHAVLRLLHERRLTLACVEADGSGRIGGWLGEAGPRVGPSVFQGGLLLPQPETWSKILGSAPEFSSPSFRYEIELARELARALQQRWGTDYALATTAFPAPAPLNASPNTEKPRWAAALAGPRGVFARSFEFVGHSAILHSRAGKQALNFLRLHLLGEG